MATQKDTSSPPCPRAIAFGKRHPASPTLGGRAGRAQSNQKYLQLGIPASCMAYQPWFLSICSGETTRNHEVWLYMRCVPLGLYTTHSLVPTLSKRNRGCSKKRLYESPCGQ